MCVLNTWYIYVFPMDVNIDMDNWEILSKHKLS